MNKRKIGTFYEDRACAFLKEQGLHIIQQNFRCKFGEIDIICRQGDCIIFTEVKYRKNEAYGYALTAVDYKKQNRICKCASYFCMKNPWIKQIRYDVIGITDTKIEWIPDAFMHIGYGFY